MTWWWCRCDDGSHNDVVMWPWVIWRKWKYFISSELGCWVKWSEVSGVEWRGLESGGALALLAWHGMTYTVVKETNWLTNEPEPGDQETSHHEPISPSHSLVHTSNEPETNHSSGVGVSEWVFLLKLCTLFLSLSLSLSLQPNKAIFIY